MQSVVLSLAEARVSLHAEGADGLADPGAPIWVRVRVNGFKASGHPIVVETRPTGAAAPRQHPLALVWEIALQRVWAVECLPGDPFGVRDRSPLTGLAPSQRCVLEAFFQTRVEEAPQSQVWSVRRWYGVTLASGERGDQDGLALVDQWVFSAERMEDTPGVTHPTTTGNESGPQPEGPPTDQA